jgi:hypothetical protein
VRAGIFCLEEAVHDEIHHPRIHARERVWFYGAGREWPERNADRDRLSFRRLRLPSGIVGDQLAVYVRRNARQTPKRLAQEQVDVRIRRRADALGGVRARNELESFRFRQDPQVQEHEVQLHVRDRLELELELQASHAGEWLFGQLPPRILPALRQGQEESILSARFGHCGLAERRHHGGSDCEDVRAHADLLCVDARDVT